MSGVTKCTTGEAWSPFSWHHSSVFHCQWTPNQVFLFLSHMLIQNANKYSFMWWNMCLVSFEIWELIFSLYQVDWWNLMKQSINVGDQMLWSGRYGCNNGGFGCTIVMSYIEINKAVSQWLLTFNLCVSGTWPLTCAFHIPCTHTPEIIDMHRGRSKENIKAPRYWPLCGKFTETGEIPVQRASYAENVSIWWRHYVRSILPHLWNII